MTERRFRRQWHRFWIPCAFSTFLFGSFAYHLPEHALLAAMGFLLLVMFALVLHRGLILAANGLVWYVVHPRFVYRRVPWTAVRDVRRGWLAGVVNLEVEPGRYEPVLWGVPRSPIVIHTRELARGDELFDAIKASRLAAA